MQRIARRQAHQPKGICNRSQRSVLSKERLVRWVAFVYAFHLALVLPFICWGAVGTPGHPHPHAHFVFMDPGLVEASATGGLIHEHIWGQHLHLDICSPSFDDLSTAASDDPAGRSTPDVTSVISIIMLVFLLGREMRPPLPSHFALAPIPSFKESAELPVPLPPPRSSLAVS